MNFVLEGLQNNSIILRRNRKEEIRLNYTKIYDLSQINKIKDITIEEKKSLLVIIKKILLSTNNYIYSSNILEITRYLIMSLLIFISFIIFYSPIYKSYFLSEKTTEYIDNSTFIQKCYCFFLFEIIELIFRIIVNNMKIKKVTKIMENYARSIIKQNENNFSLYLEDKNFDLYILRKAFFKNLINFKKENKSTLIGVKNDFYQYVIIYPNVRYYKWDRKILNEKENEIADNIIKTVKLAEKEHVKKFGFTVLIIWVLYFLSFNCIIMGKKLKSLVYRLIIFIFTKIVSYFMSNNFKENLMEKEEILSKQYIHQGYFILLSFTTFQIFKLKEEDVDNTLNINEVYKNIHKDIVNLNEKILEQ